MSESASISASISSKLFRLSCFPQIQKDVQEELLALSKEVKTLEADYAFVAGVLTTLELEASEELRHRQLKDTLPYYFNPMGH